MVLHKIIVNCI